MLENRQSKSRNINKLPVSAMPLVRDRWNRPRVGKTPLVRTMVVSDGPLRAGYDVDGNRIYLNGERIECVYELPRWMRMWKPDNKREMR